MSLETLNAALKTPPSTKVGDIRKSLKGSQVQGSFFAVVAAIDGPFSLVGLVVNNELVIEQSSSNPAGSRTIAVPLDDGLAKPFEIGWSVFAGHDIPELGAFFIRNGEVQKLATKKDLKRGKLWTAFKIVQ